MAKHVYECMFLFDSNRFAKDPNKVSDRVPETIEKCGGEVLASRLYVEQKLAYPIKGQRKGTYWLSYFRMDAERLAEFNRECKLNDNVLRNLVLKVDPRLVDTLVAVARGEAVPQEEGEGDEAAEGDSPQAEAEEEQAEVATSDA